eukprot:m.99614 g.99614  ORF g.99614 m.99614 type:complete len:148 (-) comp16768_c0_seq1:276-719(-)
MTTHAACTHMYTPTSYTQHSDIQWATHTYSALTSSLPPRIHSREILSGSHIHRYCLITNPLIVVALGLLGVTAVVATRGGGDRTILGKTFTREEQLKSAALLTIPLLWISGAGGAFFWVLGATGVLVVGHAALIPVEDEVLGAVDGV